MAEIGVIRISDLYPNIDHLFCGIPKQFTGFFHSELHVADVMDGKADESTLTTEEQSYYESAKRVLEAEEAGKKADSADYSQYMSRMVSIFKMIEEPANFLVPSFFETTDSMGSRWSSLEKMEMETVLKIITGEKDISEFDSFVEQWKSAGGDRITEEVNEAIAE